MKNIAIEAFALQSGNSLGYWSESEFDFVKDSANASTFTPDVAGVELERVTRIAAERSWIVSISLSEID